MSGWLGKLGAFAALIACVALAWALVFSGQGPSQEGVAQPSPTPLEACYSGECAPVSGNELPEGFSEELDLSALVQSGERVHCRVINSGSGEEAGEVWVGSGSWRTETFTITPIGKVTRVTVMQDGMVKILKDELVSSSVDAFGAVDCDWYAVFLANGEVNTDTFGETMLEDGNFLSQEGLPIAFKCTESNFSDSVFETPGSVCSFSQMLEKRDYQKKQYLLSICESIDDDPAAKAECIRKVIGES